MHRELRLKVLTHNVMILLRIEVFYRALLTPFLLTSVVRLCDAFSVMCSLGCITQGSLRPFDKLRAQATLGYGM